MNFLFWPWKSLEREREAGNKTYERLDLFIDHGWRARVGSFGANQ